MRGPGGRRSYRLLSAFSTSWCWERSRCLPYQCRSRRPPQDPVNALLSFAYSLLVHDCASALESVGLDAYVGFLHRDRPGRASLALDLMEELRPCMADRFVLTLINNRIVSGRTLTFGRTGRYF
ncbi:MAG: CRISPR-associated endonuclease Cas1 [Flavonifractor plautii]